MSTITREFTKEQLQQIIETDHVQCGEASALARIALASLEAVPVGTFKKGPCGYHPSFHEDAVPLYTAPPAPVSVPDEVTAEDCPAFVKYDITEVDEAWVRGFNACRAAMLQGADGALTDEDAKRVDELVMWIKRLAHSLRKANPDSKLQSDAMDYLSRKGLIGVEDILR